MPQASARINEDTDAEIQRFSHEHGLTRSEVIRVLIERGIEYDRIERDRDRLKANMQTLIEDRDEKQELVAYASEERSIAQQEQQYRNRRRSAPIWRKLYWAVFGEPVDERA